MKRYTTEIDPPTVEYKQQALHSMEDRRVSL